MDNTSHSKNNNIRRINGSFGKGSEGFNQPNKMSAEQKLKRRRKEVEKEIECPIQVVVRCRGRYDHEGSDKRVPGVIPVESTNMLKYKVGQGDRVEWNDFSFDRVFGPTASQVSIYEEVVSPILSEVLEGYSCTLFAYGQTGTGKTHTMEGNLNEIVIPPCGNAGIVPRVLYNLFEQLEKDADKVMYLVKVSMLEIYNEDVHDLLAPGEPGNPMPKLTLYSDPTRTLIIKGLEEKVIQNPEEGIMFLKQGSLMRHTAATRMNKISSRSHCIFSLSIQTNSTTEAGEKLCKVGKFNLVDLAGSEDIGRSGAEKLQAAEAGKINQSLLTLGKVIKQLYDNSLLPTSIIPTYRESKLTRILEDSLGGGTRTCIIATISLAEVDLKETVNTLKYASQAKSIKNRPRANVSLGEAALYKEYKDENAKLKAELQLARSKDGVYMRTDEYERLTRKNSQLEDGYKELEFKYTRLEVTNQDLTRTHQEMAKKVMEIQNKLEVKTTELEETLGKLGQCIEEVSQCKMEISVLTKSTQAHSDNEDKLTKLAAHLLNLVESKSSHLKDMGLVINTKYSFEQANLAYADLLKQSTDQSGKTLLDELSEITSDHTKFKQFVDSTLDQFQSNLKESSINISKTLQEGASSIKETVNIDKNASNDYIDQCKRFLDEADKQFVGATKLFTKHSSSFFNTCNTFQTELNNQHLDLKLKLDEFQQELNTKIALIAKESTQGLQGQIQKLQDELVSLKNRHKTEVESLKRHYSWADQALVTMELKEAEYKSKLMATVEAAIGDFSSCLQTDFKANHEQHLNLINSQESFSNSLVQDFSNTIDITNKNYRLQDQQQKEYFDDMKLKVTNVYELSNQSFNKKSLLSYDLKDKLNTIQNESSESIATSSNQHHSIANNHQQCLAQHHQHISKSNQLIHNHLNSLGSSHGSHIATLNKLAQDHVVSTSQTTLKLNEGILPKLETCVQSTNSIMNETSNFVKKDFKVDPTSPNHFKFVNIEEIPQEWDRMDPITHIAKKARIEIHSRPSHNSSLSEQSAPSEALPSTTSPQPIFIAPILQVDISPPIPQPQPQPELPVPSATPPQKLPPTNSAQKKEPTGPRKFRRPLFSSILKRKQ